MIGTRPPRAAVAVAGLVALIATPACRTKKPPAPAPSASSSVAAPIPGFPTVPLLAKPKWGRYARDRDLGVPAGCSLELPVRSAPLPPGAVRFIAPRSTSSELYVAVDSDGDGIVDRSGVLDASGEVAHALPWSHLDSPPVIVRGPAGFLALDTEDTGRGVRRLMLWREPGRVEPVLQGDALDVVDATCSGTTCAVLTTLASASAGPGATLLVGDGATPAATWKRIDLPAEDRHFAPFSLVRLDGASATVAMLADGEIGIFEVKDGRVTPGVRIPAAFGAYEVVLGDAPIVVAPGESLEGGCQKDGFPLHLLRSGAEPVTIDGQVPPTSVLTRGVDGGFVVAWLSPVSCRNESRHFVRAFLVGSDGKPTSSTMAVGDASGFALSTQGDAVDLWLSIGQELVWVKAHCRIPSPVR